MKNMNDILKQIIELKTDEQIEYFIINKTFLLELSSEKKTVGQNYTDSFRDYISKKIHFKPSPDFEEGKCPDLIYDDLEPYFNLIKLIKQNNCHDITHLLLLINITIYEYFNPNSIKSKKDLIIARYTTYLSNKDKSLSIKIIKKNGIAVCSEISGLAHNMFKFLGIDSEFVCGSLNDEYHAYNFIYPNGYDSEPTILIDSTNFFDYTLEKNEYEQFISGKPLTINSKNNLTYIFGLKNVNTYLESKGITK